MGLQFDAVISSAPLVKLVPPPQQFKHTSGKTWKMEPPNKKYFLTGDNMLRF
jgi:hypothetical protein